MRRAAKEGATAAACTGLYRRAARWQRFALFVLRVLPSLSRDWCSKDLAVQP